jgi:hypothetical protein
MSLFDVPQEVLDARPQGAKDFDFLQGRWLIHHKKLTRLRLRPTSHVRVSPQEGRKVEGFARTPKTAHELQRTALRVLPTNGGPPYLLLSGYE